MTLPELLLSKFHGRDSVFAVEVDGRGFRPEHRPVRQEDLQAHVSQQQGCGFYLMREDSTVTCCAVDFDDHGANSKAIIQAQQLCRAYDDCGVPCLLEISQSGSGAHVWTFFSKPIPAAEARKFMRGVLAYASINAKEIYPRQDVLDEGRPLGNLLRFPLWRLSRFVSPETLAEVDPAKAIQVTEPVTDDRFSQCMELFETYLEDHATPDFDSYTTEGLPPRVHEILAAGKSSLLFKRWHGDTTGMGGSSRSEQAFHISVQLIRAMVPTEEVEAALRYWCQIRNYEKASDTRWIKRTVCRAYNAAAGVRERKEVHGKDLYSLTDQYLDILARDEEIIVPSGVAGLDKSIGGVALGEWGVLAGRPGCLKSTLAAYWLQTATKHGHRGLMMQLEMSDKQVARKHAIMAGVNLEYIKTPEGLAKSHRQVQEFFERKEQCLYDNGCRDLDRLERSIKFYVEEHGVRFVVIDHQGYIFWRRESEYQDQTEAAKRVKQIAKECDIAVLSLVHMRRPPVGSGTAPPSLNDLRASGEIEQSADVVVAARWPWNELKAENKEDYLLYPLKCRDRDFDPRPVKARAVTHEQRFE